MRFPLFESIVFLIAFFAGFINAETAGPHYDPAGWGITEQQKANYRLALEYYRAGNMEKAFDCFMKLPVNSALYSRCELKLYRTGRHFYDRNDYLKAIAIWERINKQWDFYYRMASDLNFARKHMKYDQDSGEEQEGENGPGRISTNDRFYEQGMRELLTGNYFSAIGVFEQALQNDPYYAPAAGEIGYCHEKMGNIDLADRYYRMASGYREVRNKRLIFFHPKHRLGASFNRVINPDSSFDTVIAGQSNPLYVHYTFFASRDFGLVLSYSVNIISNRTPPHLMIMPTARFRLSDWAAFNLGFGPGRLVFSRDKPFTQWVTAMEFRPGFEYLIQKYFGIFTNVNITALYITPSLSFTPRTEFEIGFFTQFYRGWKRRNK